jgi:hypothetical protein
MSELDAIAAATDEQIAAQVEQRREACVLAGVSESEAMFFRHIDALKAEVARLTDVESAARAMLELPREVWGPKHHALHAAIVAKGKQG